ncbi:hypothetical protein HKD37_12G034617 [Glycine soja]
MGQESRASQLARTRAADGSSLTSSLSKAYEKIWDLIMIKVSVEAITSLTQYYDQSLRCFTFGDFQLAPTIEVFEGILGCPLGGRKPYLFFEFYHSLTRIARVVKISEQELDRVKQNRNGVVGIPRKRLEEKAEAWANQGEWTSRASGSNSDRCLSCLSPHKESPVIVVLADAYDTFDLRCEKSIARIVDLFVPYKVIACAPKRVKQIEKNSWQA